MYAIKVFKNEDPDVEKEWVSEIVYDTLTISPDKLSDYYMYDTLPIIPSYREGSPAIMFYRNKVTGELTYETIEPFISEESKRIIELEQKLVLIQLALDNIILNGGVL